MPLHSRRRNRVSKIRTDGGIQGLQKGKACSVLWNMLKGSLSRSRQNSTLSMQRGCGWERELDITVLCTVWTRVKLPSFSNCPSNLSLPFPLPLANPIHTSSSRTFCCWNDIIFLEFHQNMPGISEGMRNCVCPSKQQEHTYIQFGLKQPYKPTCFHVQIYWYTKRIVSWVHKLMI